jgi:sulfite reductase (NADPH) flavoprotein alpha-component
MLVQPKLKQLQTLVETATTDEMIWMNGYLAGILAFKGRSISDFSALPTGDTLVLEQEVPVKPLVSKITIAYGTETGNSKKLATEFGINAKQKGINAKVVSLDQYRLTDLAKEEYFFVVVSTHGDGEAPAAAKKFYDYIHTTSERYTKLKFSVLALGDTAYPLFCQTGEDVENQLIALSGQRIVPVQKCDTDLEGAAEWMQTVLSKLSATSANGATNGVEYKVATSNGQAPPKTKQRYEGTVLTNINLNDHGSNKETYHVEIAAENISYQPGDAIGIVPENPEHLVAAIQRVTKIDGSKSVTYKGEQGTLTDFLTKKINIFHLPERVVKKYSEDTAQAIPATRIDLLDLLKIYPPKDVAQAERALLNLEPITPRLYSIASSPEAHGSDEVHIIVARDTFEVNAVKKYGVCSNFLARFEQKNKLNFYVQPNNSFRLPEANKDVIMIGPGTGIAPFRSFLAERDATGASGRNWLFFGEQHFQSDFLYQTELQAWFESSHLSRLSLAFSRDQIEKIYVQQRIIEKGKTFFEWLESGAYLYLCGAKNMGKDVENAILQVIQTHGNKNAQEASDFLENLKEEGRYKTDVY